MKVTKKGNVVFDSEEKNNIFDSFAYLSQFENYIIKYDIKEMKPFLSDIAKKRLFLYNLCPRHSLFPSALKREILNDIKKANNKY